MRPLPVALRQRIIHLYGQNKTTREIAEYLGFCVAAVRRVRQQFKSRGTLAPQTHWRGRQTLLTGERQARRLALVAAQPDATLAELGAGLDRPFRTATVDLWLGRLNSFLLTLLQGIEMRST